MSEPLRFRLRSLAADGARRPVGIDPNGGRTQQVRLGHDSVWNSESEDVIFQRNKFYFSIEAQPPYSVVPVPVGQVTNVTAIRPRATQVTHKFWFSTTRGQVPNTQLYASTIELPSDPSQVWTVANRNANSEIVLRNLNYVEPGRISADQLFVLDFTPIPA